MHDLPSGPALLALARDVLLNDLMPLLPQDRRLDALLVANSMAIAEREAIEGEAPAQAVIRELESLYGDATLTHPALWAGSPLSRIAGEGRLQLLRRFAADLRSGAFEHAEAHGSDARAVLWRLTIAKLRCANPR